MTECCANEAMAFERTVLKVGVASSMHTFLFQNTQIIESSSRYFNPSSFLSCSTNRI